MSFTYNKSKRAWYRDDGTRVNSGNRVKSSDGTYYQLNSDGTKTKVGTISGGIDKNFAALAKKKGLNIDLENKAMRAGLIKDKIHNKWRLDSTTNSANARTTTDGRSYFKGADGQWYNFDSGLRRDQDIKALQSRAIKSAEKATNEKMGIKPTDNWAERFKQKGVVGGIVDGLMDWAKVNENSGWRTAVDLGASAIYSVPVLGTALSVADAGIAASQGNWGDAALTLGLGILPGGKTAKKFVQGSKALRLTNKLLPKNYKRLTEAQKAYKKELLNLASNNGITKKEATKLAREHAPKTVEELEAMGTHGQQWLKNYRTHGIGKLKRTYGDKEAKIRNFASKPLIFGGATSMIGQELYNENVRDQYTDQFMKDYIQKDTENNISSLGTSLSLGRMNRNHQGDDYIGFNSLTGQEMDEDTWNQARNTAAYGGF